MNETNYVGFCENFEPQKILAMPDQNYRRFKAVSKSSLDWIDVTPAHFKHVVIDKNWPEPSPAMITGSAFDSLLLTPKEFEKDFIVAPNIRRGTKAWEEFELMAGGRRVLKQDDYDQIQAMRESVMRHPLARSILTVGDPQVSYKWQDPTTGILCKSRADFVRADNVIIDVKSTGEGGGKADAFGRTAFNFRYHVQAAFYSDGAAIVEKRPDAFLFVVVEREAPYAVSVFHCDDHMLELGRQTYQRDLDTYARCFAENKWPAYPEEIQKLTLPRWAFN